MTVATQSTVVGVFPTRQQAEQALDALRRAGFGKEELGLMAPHKAGETDTDPGAVGTVLGGVTGTLAGGLLAGLLGSVITVAVPGIGMFILAGVLATIVTGSAIAGALIGMGVSEDEARHYESEVKSGKTLVVVKAGERYPDAWAILAQHGAAGLAAESLQES